MIGTLRGILQKKMPPYLLIEVNGIGYEVQAPMTTFYQLPEAQQPVLLHTHLSIREDAHQLYGFMLQKDRDLFRTLIKVNGIGPKLALGILSGIPPEQFIAAVQKNDSSTLINIPGIGKKTAERLIIECRDALKNYTPSLEKTTDETQKANQNMQDAIEALSTLGYKPQDAKRSIEKVYQAGHSTEVLIRCALQLMVRTQ